jgi:hypothetical protein
MIVTSFRTRAAVSAAAVVAALTLAVAPSAHAQNQWGGIATGPNGNWVIWHNSADYSSAAYFGNWAGCASGGIQCRRVLVFQDCGALVYNGTAFSAADGDSKAAAESAAMADLPGGQVVASVCNDGGPSGRTTSF